VFTTHRFRAPRALAAFVLSIGLLALPNPITGTPRANAATFPITSGTYIIEKITWSCACSVDATKPPALSSFDVKVDGVSNPATAFTVFGSAIMDLSLTTPVYSGSVITFAYNAPAVDNTLANNAFQKSNGEDYASFTLTITNMAPSRPEPNAPGTPTVAAGEESATITVTAPSSGRTPTSYVVTASPGGATCTVTGASGECTITGLTAGTAYTFTTVAMRAGFSSAAGAASPAVTVLAKPSPVTAPPAASVAPAIDSNAPSWDVEPATESETDAFTEGFWPSAIPGNIIITNEFGFTVDAKNGIKPKIRMKKYAGKIKMTISATYKDGAKTKKYKCTYAPFGSTKKMKTAKWKWYTPKKACILPKPLVTALQTGTTKLSAKGKWTRQWLTSAKKARPDKTKIKPRTLKYTVRAKPAAVK
jgi:hypothetical protein